MYEDNVKIDLRVKECKNVKWNEMPDNRVYLRALLSSVLNLQGYIHKQLGGQILLSKRYSSVLYFVDRASLYNSCQ
jgi:hypothetical protein